MLTDTFHSERKIKLHSIKLVLLKKFMNKLQVVDNVVDVCSKYQLESVFAPLADLPNTSTKAEMISHCLNIELGAYGLQTHISPDRTAVLIDDEGMCKVIYFFKNKGYHPILTPEHSERIGTVIDFANKNKVDLVWSQVGFKKKYYSFKHYGFNGIHLYNLININTVNAAAAALSPTGAAGLTMGGVVALSWSGSLFLSTLESYIPNNMTSLKLVVSGLKFGTVILIRCVEWVYNHIIGFAENLIIGDQLPINIMDAYKLSIGPKLKNIAKLKKPVLGWLVDQLNKLNK
jgi:hypothetical protein